MRSATWHSQGSATRHQPAPPSAAAARSRSRNSLSPSSRHRPPTAARTARIARSSALLHAGGGCSARQSTAHSGSAAPRAVPAAAVHRGEHGSRTCHASDARRSGERAQRRRAGQRWWGRGEGRRAAARRAAGCAVRRAAGGVARRDGGSAHVLAIPCVDVVVGQAVLGRYAVLGRRLRARGGCGGDRRTLTRAALARLLHPEPIDDRHAVGERPMRLRALRVLAQQVRAHHRGVLVEHRDSCAQEQLHLGAVRSPDHGKHGTLQRRRHRRRIHGRAAALSWLVCGHGRGRRSAFRVCLGVTVPLRLLG